MLIMVCTLVPNPFVVTKSKPSTGYATFATIKLCTKYLLENTANSNVRSTGSDCSKDHPSVKYKKTFNKQRFWTCNVYNKNYVNGSIM